MEAAMDSEEMLQNQGTEFTFEDFTILKIANATCQDENHTHPISEVEELHSKLRGNHINKASILNCLQKVEKIIGDKKSLVQRLLNSLAIMKTSAKSTLLVQMLDHHPNETAAGPLDGFPIKIKEPYGCQNDINELSNGWPMDLFLSAPLMEQRALIERLTILISSSRVPQDELFEGPQHVSSNSLHEFFAYGIGTKNADHNPPVFVVASIDRCIAIGYGDGSIGIFHPDRTANQIKMITHNDSVFSLTFLENCLVTGGSNGIIKLFDPNTCDLIQAIESCHASDVIAMVGEGDVVISGSEDRRMVSWQVVRDQDGNVQGLIYQDRIEFEGRVSALALHGVHLAAACKQQTAVWHVINDAVTWLIPHPSTVRTIALHSGILVTACLDTLVRVWDCYTHQSLFTLSLHSSPIASVYIDARRIISACEGREIRVWSRQEIATGSRSKNSLLETRIAPLQESVICMAVSGSFIFAAHANNSKVSVIQLDNSDELPNTDEQPAQPEVVV